MFAKQINISYAEQGEAQLIQVCEELSDLQIPYRRETAKIDLRSKEAFKSMSTQPTFGILNSIKIYTNISLQ